MVDIGWWSRMIDHGFFVVGSSKQTWEISWLMMVNNLKLHWSMILGHAQSMASQWSIITEVDNGQLFVMAGNDSWLVSGELVVIYWLTTIKDDEQWLIMVVVENEPTNN